MIPAIVITVIVAIVGGAIWTSIVLERKRKEKVAGVADSLGLSYVADDDESLRNRFSGMTLFQTGHTKSSGNCMSGDSGDVRISIFDYTYTTGSGKHKSTRRMTVVALESANLRIPSFSMRPESIFDKLGGMLGFQDIDFDDDQEFSNSFVLKGENEEAIRKLFQRDLREGFVAKSGINVEATPGKLICYRGSSRSKPEDYPNLLKEAYEIYGLFVDQKTE